LRWPTSNDAPASVPYRLLCKRGIVLHVGIKIARLNLGDIVHGGLSLSMKSLDCNCPKSEAREHCQGDCVWSPHCLLLYHCKVRRALARTNVPLRMLEAQAKNRVGVFECDARRRHSRCRYTQGGFGTSRWSRRDIHHLLV